MSVQTSGWFEIVPVKGLVLNERDQSQVTFESSEGACANFSIGPLSFDGVVVGFIKEGFVYDVFAVIDSQISQGAAVRPQAIGQDIGFSHVR